MFNYHIVVCSTTRRTRIDDSTSYSSSNSTYSKTAPEASSPIIIARIPSTTSIPAPTTCINAGVYNNITVIDNITINTIRISASRIYIDIISIAIDTVIVSVVICFFGVLKLNFLGGFGGVCVGTGTKLVPCAV